jgi:hypothetical protein
MASWLAWFVRSLLRLPGKQRPLMQRFMHPHDGTRAEQVTPPAFAPWTSGTIGS